VKLGTAKRAREYNVYRITVYNGLGQVTGKFEVAAQNRRDAEDAGIWWAIDNEVSPYRVSVMRSIRDRMPETMLVA
jgi:hypothetical protein